MIKPIISIKHLSKTYDGVNVLNGIEWDVQKGDIVALLGKNGAGKSTLLECIMNIRQFEFGELKIWGYSWNDMPQEKREKIAYVSQEIAGFEWMKVKEYITYLGGFFPSFDQYYANNLMVNWDLYPDKKVKHLSKGQKQILHVIQAFSTKPELLILDEPVAHLDSGMRRKFIAELIDLAYENKTTVLFSSHIISDVERIANQVAILKSKKIEINQDVEQLKLSIGHLKISGNDPLDQTEYYKKLSQWQSYDKGATAKIIQPLDNSIDEYIKNAPNPIEHTPMSLEDWYLEMQNEAD